MPNDDLADLLRQLPGGSGAFGAIPLRGPYQDDPSHLGAGNLVSKAVSSLHEGDEGRAQRAVAHATRLGWCGREEMPYGVFVAHLELFEEITESLETGEPTEWAWRDVCLAVLGEADEIEARILRQLLGDILLDYDLPKREARQVQQAIGGPDDDLAFGLEEGSSADAVSAVIWAMVCLTHRIHQRLYH